MRSPSARTGLLVLLAWVALPCVSQAADSDARASRYDASVSLGGYVAAEWPRVFPRDSNRNDTAIVSSRLRLRAQDLGAPRLLAVGELRDKHDFFDKLDRERLALSGNNSFQVRQLSVSYRAPGDGFFGSAGRFPMVEAGAVQVDGGALGYRWRSSWSAGAFGGLNPRRVDEASLDFRSDSRIAGMFGAFEPGSPSWESHRRLTGALVLENVGSEIDRVFLFHQWVEQWAGGRRIMTHGFVDFAPKLRAQNLSASYYHAIGEDLALETSGLALDVVEYRRRQGIRERVSPSAYHELGARFELFRSRNPAFELATSHGRRIQDGLRRHELRGAVSIDVGSLELKPSVGVARNFVSDDLFVGLQASYQRDQWEIDGSTRYAFEDYFSGEILRPLTTDLNLGFEFGRGFTGSVGIEHAIDENANVVGGAARVTYAIGNLETAGSAQGGRGQ